MKATRKLPFVLSLRHSQDTRSTDADADILKWVLLSSLCRISGIHTFAFLNEIQLSVGIHIQSIGQHSALHYRRFLHNLSAKHVTVFFYPFDWINPRKK